MEHKYYQIIGYGMKKNTNIWEQFNKTAIVECPKGVNPYIYIPISWQGLLDHWIVTFEEIKEMKKQ